MTFIIAIDPGQTTGVAMFAKARFEGDGDMYRTWIEPHTNVINGLDEMFARKNVSDVLGPMDLDAVVIEHFATAGRLSKYGLLTIDLVGQVKGWCKALDIFCTTQSPMSRKPFIIKAQQLGITQSIHEVDALAHLLLYLNQHT